MGIQLFENSDQPYISPFMFTQTTPYSSALGEYKTMTVPLRYTENVSIAGIVIGVFHNSIGQTLEVSTSTIIAAQEQNVTSYLVITLAYGNYSVNVFVWSVSGTSLSGEESIFITC